MTPDMTNMITKPTRNCHALILVVPILLATPEALGFSFQPPAGRTGAPPGNMTCADCHTSSGNGSLTLEFGDGNLTYLPGETYPLKVILEDLGQQRFGFSMTSREGNAPTVDTGTWTAGSSTGVYDGGRHIGHQSAPFSDNGFTFEVMWTAPPEDVGPITFYAAGNAANGNGANGAGDNIYTQQLTVDPGAVPEPFWSASAVSADGWRNTGEGYDDLRGIGWINDATWPWFFTFAHPDTEGGDWIFVFTDISDRFGFWGYNFTGGYYFFGAATIGWYYSYETGAEGWGEYNF